MIICPHCEKQIEINKDRQCPVCHAYYDLCTKCNSELPDIDDFGICLCKKCYDKSPSAKKCIARQVEKENILEGIDNDESF